MIPSFWMSVSPVLSSVLMLPAVRVLVGELGVSWSFVSLLLPMCLSVGKVFG